MAELDFRDYGDENASKLELGLERDQCSATIYRGGRWKYIHFAGLEPMLFDLEDDPFEFHDLAKDESKQGVMLECAQALLTRRMRFADRTLTDHVATDRGLWTAS